MLCCGLRRSCTTLRTKYPSNCNLFGILTGARCPASTVVSPGNSLALAQVLLHAGLHAVPVNAKGKLEEEGSEPYLPVGLAFDVLDRVGCREKALNLMNF